MYLAASVLRFEDVPIKTAAAHCDAVSRLQPRRTALDRRNSSAGLMVS